MIWDCFLFFNELDLLEIRLEELHPVVDRFVIISSLETNQGNPTPLYFYENRGRFKKHLDKITYLVMPQPKGADAMLRQDVQRDSAGKALGEIWKETDLVLFGDVDEIPRRADFQKIIQEKYRGPKVVRLSLRYYYLNGWITDNYGGPSPVFLRPFDLKRQFNNQLSSLRRLSKSRNWDTEPSGWHFSYLGGIAGIMEKVRAYGNWRWNNKTLLDPARLKERVDKGMDIGDRPTKIEYRPMDDTYPTAVLSDPKKYSHLIREVKP